MLSLRYLIEGSLGLNEDKTLKDTIDGAPSYKDGVEYQPGLWDNIFKPGKVNREKMMSAMRQAQDERAKDRARAIFDVSCYLSAYDVHTGEVTATVMGIGTNGLEAINDAVEELIDALAAADSGLYVAAVEGDKVFLDLGANGNIKAGDRYQLVHLGEPIRDRSGQVIGHKETEVAEVEVTEIQPLLSVAKIVTKAGEISRGDAARPAKH